MIKRYITYTTLGFIFMLGWNVFLVQRDDAMYDAYYRSKAIENLKKPPLREIR